jgi:hypothetical protein
MASAQHTPFPGKVVEVVAVEVDVVVVAPSGAHNHFATVGCTFRLPNWSTTGCGVSVVFAHFTL